MKTMLRQCLCLLLMREIAATWWMSPFRGKNWRGLFDNRRWITTTDINSGRSQSPIDLTDYTIANCPAINYSVNYNNSTLLRFENTGHTVRVLAGGERPTLSGGPLTGQYVLQEVHFHWGSNDNQGSEHTMDGDRYPMETHAVHYNSKYGSFQEALKHKDGLCVIAFLFDITPYRNSIFKAYDNAMMLPLTSNLDNIPSQNDSVQLSAQESLKWLWPYVAKDHYFTYTGSLTTPLYMEVVTWIVYDGIIPMSEEQIEEFRQRVPEGNYRQVQPLNGRLVYFCDSQSSRTAKF